MSKLRLPYFNISPDPLEGFRAIRESLEKSDLGNDMIELMYLRVSQINGCSFCLKKHSEALVKMGVRQDKLNELAGWRLSQKFDAREKAALEWCEAITDINRTRDIADAIFDMLTAHFSEKEISDLTYAIALMNGMNRLSVPMRQ